jgi:hypothetical protein
MRRVGLALLVALCTAALFSGPAVADDPPPVTVPETTVPETPAPDPRPAVPAPKPTRKPPARPVQTRPPRRVQPSTPSRPSTPAVVAPTRAVKAATKTRVKRAAKTRPKKAKHATTVTKRQTTTTVTTKRPQPVAPAPQRQAASSSTESSKGIGSALLFFVLAAVLLAVVALKKLGSDRLDMAWAGALAGRRGASGTRGVPVRDVVAEVVALPQPRRPAHAPLVHRPDPPRRAPATDPVPAVVEEPAPAAPELEAPQLAPAAAVATAVLPTAEPPTTEAAPVEPARPTEEICAIAVWKGYAKARFYARLEPADEDEFAVAESPPFRFRGNGAPDQTKASQNAHRALVEQLLLKGWEQDGREGPWYAVRFRRELPVEE